MSMQKLILCKWCGDWDKTVNHMISEVIMDAMKLFHIHALYNVTYVLCSFFTVMFYPK